MICPTVDKKIILLIAFIQANILGFFKRIIWGCVDQNPNQPRLEISISKKFYRLAVERNKIKRKIKEIFRDESLDDLVGGILVFSVFKPFGELSYKDASDKIKSAIKSVADNKENEY